MTTTVFLLGSITIALRNGLKKDGKLSIRRVVAIALTIKFSLKIRLEKQVVTHIAKDDNLLYLSKQNHLYYVSTLNFFIYSEERLR